MVPKKLTATGAGTRTRVIDVPWETGADPWKREAILNKQNINFIIFRLFIRLYSVDIVQMEYLSNPLLLLRLVTGGSSIENIAKN